ncbi:MAG: pilin [Candidatus Buchananbacteria bacterium]
MSKKIFFGLTLLLLTFTIATPLLAVDKSAALQVDLGYGTVVANLETYIGWWYKLIMGTVGVLATIYIMWGGFKWLTAAGSSSQISDAQETIKAAIAGLLIALFSFSILYIINPNLLNLNTEGIGSNDTTTSTADNTPGCCINEYESLKHSCSYIIKSNCTTSDTVKFYSNTTCDKASNYCASTNSSVYCRSDLAGYSLIKKGDQATINAVNRKTNCSYLERPMYSSYDGSEATTAEFIALGYTSYPQKCLYESCTNTISCSDKTDGTACDYPNQAGTQKCFRGVCKTCVNSGISCSSASCCNSLTCTNNLCK